MEARYESSCGDQLAHTYESRTPKWGRRNWRCDSSVVNALATRACATRDLRRPGTRNELSETKMKWSLYGHNHHHERSPAPPPPPMSPPPGRVQGGKEKPSDSHDELDALLYQAQLYVSLTEPSPPTSPSFPKRDKTRGQDYYHISSLTTTTDTTSSPTKTVTQPAMASASPPPRPSRANTANLNDVYQSTQPTPISQRRISAPIPINQGDVFYANPNEQMPPVASTSQSPSQIRPRAATTKSKKGMFANFMTEFLGSNKPVAISTPYDPVHLTHVGFNSSTGEFTGLPKEWQQLLQESGISRMEQEKNPQAVMEIVKFYQEGGGDVWDKMGAAPAPPRDEADSPGDQQSPVSCLAFVVYYMRDPERVFQAPPSRATEEDAVQPFTRTNFLQASTCATPDRFSRSRSVHIPASSFQVSQPEPVALQVKHH